MSADELDRIAGRPMRSLKGVTLVFVAITIGCGGPSFVVAVVDDGGTSPRDASRHDGASDSGTLMPGDVQAVDSSSDDSIAPVLDSGSIDSALPAPDSAPPALCCANAQTSQAPNVHCGVGAWAPCSPEGGLQISTGTGTYNTANCTAGLGGSCQAWPDSYDYCLPADCCQGTVAVCGPGQ